MREKLSEHQGKYVLCKGWIKSWQDINEIKPQRRIVVSQPTIKESNKDILFVDLPRISTEHHLNLFIDQEDLSDYDTDYELNSTIQFSGIVQGYMRSNGSVDYGIYPTQQSLLHDRLDWICNSYIVVAEKLGGVYNEDFYKFNKIQENNLLFLSNELEKAGDQLPTFRKTYSGYRKEIDQWLKLSDYAKKQIEVVCSNRAMRRANNIKKNFLHRTLNPTRRRARGF